MVTYTKPQQRKKEESKRLRGGEIRSSLLILDLKDGKLQDSRKDKEGKTFHKLIIQQSSNEVSIFRASDITQCTRRHEIFHQVPYCKMVSLHTSAQLTV